MLTQLQTLADAALLKLLLRIIASTCGIRKRKFLDKFVTMLVSIVARQPSLHNLLLCFQAVE
ncbi:hypothetical protein GYH30_024793 [Glycine max]|nr:hypothetical protein GYH30_024793 [Glycine max]